MAKNSKEVQDKAEAKRAPRFSYAVFLMYPESAPEDWREALGELHVKAFVSPLHDKDLWTKRDEKDNPEHKAGTPKKAHWHVMLIFDGVKSDAQVREMISSVTGVDKDKVFYMVPNSGVGMARYLCHTDEKKKVHYDPADVEEYSGACYIDYCANVSDKYTVIAEMEAFVNKYCVTSFADMCDYARVHNPLWHKALCDYAAFIIDKYIKSYDYSIKNQKLDGLSTIEQRIKDMEEGWSKDDWTKNGWTKIN